MSDTLDPQETVDSKELQMGIKIGLKMAVDHIASERAATLKILSTDGKTIYAPIDVREHYVESLKALLADTKAIWAEQG